MIELRQGRSSWWRPALLVAVVVMLLVARRPLMFSGDLWLACQNDNPSPATLKALLANPPVRERVINALWATGKIQHREAAAEFLKRRINWEPDLVRRFTALLEEGVADPDQSVRKDALSARGETTDEALARVRSWWKGNFTNWSPADAARSRLFQAARHSRPPLELVNADMLPVSTASLRGRPVLLFFFVTFCGTCQQMLPEKVAGNNPG